MTGANRYLLPVKGARVKIAKGGDAYRAGTVVAAVEAGEGAMVSVKWQDTKETTKESLKAIESGFQPGMEVQDIPHSRIRKSLGEGVVLKNRYLGGRYQVLVDFPALGKQLWLPFENLRQIKGAEHRFVLGQKEAASGAENFRLKTLAHALELWNENTGALSNMEIDPLPHQIHLVHHILASGNLNWMIADDVGLGKTIETGMLLSALKQRGVLNRVLLVTPAGLTKQWQDELNHKFKMGEFQIYGEDFTINNSRHWKMYDHVIASIDCLKDPSHLELLQESGGWDIIIFDEAHRLSRRQYGLKMDMSQRFQLAANLRRMTDALLLLTATPHQGMQDKFQALLELLHPERRDEIDTLALNPEIISDMIFRNNKADVTDAEGNFIFKGKQTHAVSVPVSDEMMEFDQQLQQYLRQGYSAGAAMGNQGRAIGFVMTVYRKLAASSIAAIHNALCNRKAKLQKRYVEEIEDRTGESLDWRFNGEWEESQLGSANEFFEGELGLLDQLISSTEKLKGQDKKLEGFIDTLISKIHANNTKEKILIFTEYKTTQAYLKQALEKSFGQRTVDLINGSMSHSERQNAINHFEESGRFLISTEAGGEGINLQRKCHIMINYDLPWNPMRLVQRIGRLYRYGQKKPVVIFNMHSPDTADAQVINLMYTRITQVVQDMAGVSSEFNERLQEDIIGEISDLLDIEEILENAVTDGITRTKERIEEALEKAKSATKMQRELFDHAASFDPNEIKEELAISIEHLQAFAQGMFAQTGIEIVEKTHEQKVWHIRIPEELMAELGTSRSRYEVTFDRFLATHRPNTHMLDLDSFIMKSLVERAKSYEFGGLAAVVDTKSLQPGALIAGLLRWQNDQGMRMRQEYAVYHITQAGKSALNPAALSEWLKSPACGGDMATDRDTNKRWFQNAKVAANSRLDTISNKYLHPQNVQWVAGAWVTNN